MQPFHIAFSFLLSLSRPLALCLSFYHHHFFRFSETHIKTIKKNMIYINKVTAAQELLFLKGMKYCVKFSEKKSKWLRKRCNRNRRKREYHFSVSIHWNLLFCCSCCLFLSFLLLFQHFLCFISLSGLMSLSRFFTWWSASEKNLSDQHRFWMDIRQIRENSLVICAVNVMCGDMRI